jgi:hypothetical protein
MSLSTRVFILDKAGDLFRVPGSKFSAMLSIPSANRRLSRFASHRVRAAEAVVELQDRRPSRVVRIVYFMLQFDDTGALDKAKLMRQSAAALDAYYEAATPKAAAETVVDATSRLLVRGGRWTPTAEFELAIRDAALGKVKCLRA